MNQKDCSDGGENTEVVPARTVQVSASREPRAPTETTNSFQGLAEEEEEPRDLLQGLNRAPEETIEFQSPQANATRDSDSDSDSVSSSSSDSDSVSSSDSDTTTSSDSDSDDESMTKETKTLLEHIADLNPEHAKPFKGKGKPTLEKGQGRMGSFQDLLHHQDWTPRKRT